MTPHDLHIDLHRFTTAVHLLAGIVEGSNDAIIAKDRDGRIISWNPAAERLFGYREVEAIGQHVSLLVPETHRGEDTKVFQRILGGDRVQHYETKRRRKDGGLVDVAVTVSALHGPEGQIVGASKIVRDITDLRAARATEQQLASIIENSDDAIISKDARGLITSWNAAAERMFGYSAEEAIGQPVSLMFPPELVGRERDILGEILAGKKVDHYETRRRTRDGRIIDVALTVSPLRDADGVIIGASKIARDITERKLAEVRDRRAVELAQANERMAAADRAKDEFLAIANHELRTPLTAISGFSDTLLNRGDILDEDQRQEFLEIIDTQAARLTRLVDDLLTLTRSQDDRDEPEPVPVRDRVEGMLREQGRLDVTVHGDDELCAAVDPDHLRQIVLNYVDNATKYGAGRIQVDIDRIGEHVVVSVSDEGPGIVDCDASELFEPFARSQEARDDRVPGTGLGLAIVRRLARSYDGDAWYEPSREMASRFRVRLPLAQAGVASTPADSTGITAAS